MKIASIKNDLFIFFVFILLTNCSGHKKQENSQNKNPLVFNVEFDAFTNIQLCFDKDNMQVDSEIWSKHETDTVVYFNIHFNNLKKETVCLKTKLVATRIPLLLKYSYLEENRVMLQIVQQYNTIYSDSIIFEINSVCEVPIAYRAYNIGYQKNGAITICQLPIIQQYDTIDISNPNNEHICCIEQV